LVELLVNRLNGTINHEFYIDGSATLEDAFLDDDKWHSLLAFGRGRGGKFYTVLDITKGKDWDGNTGNVEALPVNDATNHPILRFTVGNKDDVVDADVGGGPTNYDGMGETWSVPVMGPVKTGSGNQWVLFAGSGYGCDGTDEGRYLYVLKIEDGSIVRKFGPIANNATAPVTHNAMIAWPTIFNPHEAGEDDNRDFVTRAYIGDLQGNVHKLECSNTDPDQWTFNVFYSLGVNQPISAPIAIMNQKNMNKILVFVGTGGDSRVTLPADEFFVFAGFVDNDIDGANTPGTPITDPTSGDAFILDLPPGEEVFVSPVVASAADGADGTVFVATTKPQINADCEYEFSSTLFAFDATTGLGAFDLDPATDGTQSSTDLGTQKVTGLYFRDEHLYVSQSGGIDAAAQTSVLGSNDFSSSDKSGGLGGGGGAIIRVLTWNYRLSPF
jgi:Tfp pilus tip-associated adhesin PilY1